MKNKLMYTFLFLITSVSCKTRDEMSNVLQFPKSHESKCGLLTHDQFTSNPNKKKYTLEPADGASAGIMGALHLQEVCISADFSKEPVIVKSAHYIRSKYEKHCGTIKPKETEDGVAGLFTFSVENELFTLEATDGAVLNVLNAKSNQKLGIVADFGSWEENKIILVESVQNILDSKKPEAECR